jgi:putative NIF3 family GTP cyclohydrolase 1 type 2
LLPPILFSGIKKNNRKNRTRNKAIKNDIAIYAVHTALDNHQNGVNKIFCNALICQYHFNTKQNFIRKLVTFTITENAEKVQTPCLKLGQETLAIMKIAVSVLKVLVPIWVTKIAIHN